MSHPQQLPPQRGRQASTDANPLVFLTISTYQRIEWLTNIRVQRLLHRVFLVSRAWLVGPYLLMPDHLHLLCVQNVASCDLNTWIQYWQRNFAQLHQEKDWGFHPTSHHHYLRRAESRDQQWSHVEQIPIRSGLVETIDEWPYKGVIFDI